MAEKIKTRNTKLQACTVAHNSFLIPKEED